MLLQSHANEIHLLPALPKAWSQGSVTGLCARGGFEVDLYWQDGKLDKGIVRSKTGGVCRLRSATPIRVSLAGMPVATSGSPNEVVFSTQPGRSYTLETQIP
jgi:alpha-L-fucosidase 2